MLFMRKEVVILLALSVFFTLLLRDISLVEKVRQRSFNNFQRGSLNALKAPLQEKVITVLFMLPKDCRVRSDSHAEQLAVLVA